MRSCKFAIFFCLTLSVNTIQFQQSTYYDHRRLLHEPLFPVTSDPPPQPPPPPPVNPHSDQPFFPQVPITTSSPPSPPPPTEARENVTPRIPAAPQQAKRGGGQTQTITIAISVGIVTLGMLSALAFFVYRHCAKNNNETRKLVGSNSDGLNESSRVNSSRFLYIGTVEPSRVSQRDDEVKEAKGSPYHRLKKKVDKSDRYRPSPELQPLPPLGKVAPPPMWKSPLAGESGEDEESCDGGFYTPQYSSVKSDGKASSSKSRTFALSPDIKPVIIPAIKHPSPGPQETRSSPRQPVWKQPDSRLANLFPPTRPKSLLPAMPSNLAPPAPPPPPPPPPSRLSRPPVAPPPPLGLSRPPKAPSLNVTPQSHIEQIVENTTILNCSSKGNSNSSEVVDNSKNRFDGGDEVGEVRPRLKPLHWDKVRATSDRVTVWDQLDAGSFQLNEDRMESLFGCNSAMSVVKDSNRRSVLPPVEKENRVLDPKKSQNIAILLRALNVTVDEVSEALLEGNPESIDAELLETLVKMAPTKEEEVKLCNYSGEVSKLGSAERFLKAVLDIPFAFKRVEAMLYRVNFDAEIRYLRKSFETLEAASEELKNSRLFLKLLEAVLRTGNRMNVGTNRGDAKAFKLDTLLKLVDIKGTDGKTTLLHFVVEEIIRSEGANFDSVDGNKMNFKIREEDIRKRELQVVAGLSRDLINVKQSAGMDSDVLSSYLSKLERGLAIIRGVLQFEKQDVLGRFINSMRKFLKEAEEEISRIKADEKRVLSLVKEVTEYFHGDAGKEEAHPFRIFVIVRDFLSILDKVCKDVGRFQNNAVVGSARSFRICPAASLPVLNRYNTRQDISSDEESSSS